MELIKMHNNLAIVSMSKEEFVRLIKEQNRDKKIERLYIGMDKELHLKLCSFEIQRRIYKEWAAGDDDPDLQWKKDPNYYRCYGSSRIDGTRISPSQQALGFLRHARAFDLETWEYRIVFHPSTVHPKLP